jgi:hypothetical protein
MNRVVYKYPLPPVGAGVISMAKNARIVHFDSQNNVWHIWALCYLDAPTEQRRFEIIGTGRNVPDSHEHVKTALDGPFVWHLFEVRPT